MVGPVPWVGFPNCIKTSKGTERRLSLCLPRIQSDQLPHTPAAMTSLPPNCDWKPTFNSLSYFYQGTWHSNAEENQGRGIRIHGLLKARLLAWYQLDCMVWEAFQIQTLTWKQRHKGVWFNTQSWGQQRWQMQITKLGSVRTKEWAEYPYPANQGNCFSTWKRAWYNIKNVG